MAARPFVPARPAVEIVSDVAAWYTRTFGRSESVITPVSGSGVCATVAVSFPDRESGPWSPAPITETVTVIRAPDGTISATLTCTYRRHADYENAAPASVRSVDIRRSYGIDPAHAPKPDTRKKYRITDIPVPFACAETWGATVTRVGPGEPGRDPDGGFRVYFDIGGGPETASISVSATTEFVRVRRDGRDVYRYANPPRPR